VERYKREHDRYALAGLGIDRQANTEVVTASSHSLDVVEAVHPDVLNVSRRCVLPVGQQPNESSEDAESRVTGMGYLI
jgi:hypothetical protein